MTQFSIYLDLK